MSLNQDCTVLLFCLSAILILGFKADCLLMDESVYNTFYIKPADCQHIWLKHFMNLREPESFI